MIFGEKLVLKNGEQAQWYSLNKLKFKRIGGDERSPLALDIEKELDVIIDHVRLRNEITGKSGSCVTAAQGSFTQIFIKEKRITEFVK